MSKRERGGDGASVTTSIIAPLPLSSVALGTLTLSEGESVRHEQANTQVFVGSRNAGSGALFVTTQRLAWVPVAAAEQGFAIEYPNIILHAICRDSDAYDKPCVFCQLVAPEEADSLVDSDAAVNEVRLVPADAASLDAIFEAMSACAELHPDMEDDEEDGSGFISADSMMMGSGLTMGGGEESSGERSVFASKFCNRQILVPPDTHYSTEHPPFSREPA